MLKRGFYTFIFACEEDREIVLMKGSWCYGDAGLVLLAWNEHFDSSYAFHDLQFLWFHLVDLPPHLVCAHVFRGNW